MRAREDWGARCSDCNGARTVTVRGEEALAKARREGRRLLHATGWRDAGGREKYLVECACRVRPSATATAKPAPEPVAWDQGELYAGGAS